jgi:hypothetical protein
VFCTLIQQGHPTELMTAMTGLAIAAIWRAVFTCFEYIVIDNVQHFPFHI